MGGRVVVLTRDSAVSNVTTRRLALDGARDALHRRSGERGK